MFYAKLLDSMDNIQAMGYTIATLKFAELIIICQGFLPSITFPTHFHLMCQHPSLMNKSLKSFNLVLQSVVQLCCPFANHIFSKSFPFVNLVRFQTTYFHFSFYLVNFFKYSTVFSSKRTMSAFD